MTEEKIGHWSDSVVRRPWDPPKARQQLEDNMTKPSPGNPIVDQTVAAFTRHTKALTDRMLMNCDRPTLRQLILALKTLTAKAEYYYGVRTEQSAGGNIGARRKAKTP